MRLIAPSQSLDFRARDIYGKQFQLSNMIGERVMLSFFRDVACPFSRLIKFGSKEDINTSQQLSNELKKLRKENIELKKSQSGNEQE